MSRVLHSLLLCLALGAAAAYGIEVPIGGGKALVDGSEFYIVPNGRDVLTVKCMAVPVVHLYKAGGGAEWQSQDLKATATMDGNGVITLQHLDFLKCGPARLVFKDGLLADFERLGGGQVAESDAKSGRVLKGKPVKLARLWIHASEKQVLEAKANWWGDSGRLRLGYFNPNAAGTLFAELALVFFALAVVIRRRIFLRCIFGAAAAIMTIGLFLTGSRGSLVGLFAGAALVVVCRLGRRIFRLRSLVALGLFAVLAAATVFAADRLSGGRLGSDLLTVDGGNVQRMRAWAAAPEMAAAAPAGWGAEPGRAYCDWFQSTDDGHRLYYLVNSHLTWLVQFGRAGRCAYVAAWLACFALLLLFAPRSATVQVALAVWAAFAVHLWFSTVGIFPTLWIVPAVCGVAALVDIGMQIARDGRVCGRRAFIGVCAAACIGCVAPLVMERVGRGQAAKRDVPVTFDGKCVRVGSGEPKIAILRDSTVLAGDCIGCFGHELRDWLSRTPDAGAVLVVDDPAALPHEIDCLVAAGMGARRYLAHRKSNIRDDSYCHARRTVFLSPPFGPAAVPETMLAQTDLRIITGEFAARCDEGYSRRTPGVTIVPKCELYVPDWMSLAGLGGNGRNGR